MLSLKKVFFRWLSLLCLFLYIFPFQLKALPLPNTRILQILGLVCLFVYVLSNKRIHKAVLTYALLGCCICFIGVISIVINETDQLTFALTKGVYMLLYICSSFFVIYMMSKAYYPFTPTQAFESFIWVTVAQAIISLLFFCFPNILELYNSIVLLDDDAIQKAEALNAFRLNSIGSVKYANAAVHYGIALWLLILLYLTRDSRFYHSTPSLYVLGPLFCLCGILSARTFFIILVVTILYVIYLIGYRRICLIVSVLGRLFVPMLIAGACIILYMVVHNLDFIIEWALELFINMADSGAMESASTNELKEMYVFPQTIKTWIIGDGMSNSATGGFYMNSDVGYIRSLYYWGIIGSVVYYVAQCIYVSVLKKTYRDIKTRKFINVLLIWFFIYSMKEFWAVEPYWAFLLCVTLFSQQSYTCYNGNNRVLLTTIPPDRA